MMGDYKFLERTKGVKKFTSTIETRITEVNKNPVFHNEFFLNVNIPHYIYTLNESVLSGHMDGLSEEEIKEIQRDNEQHCLNRIYKLIPEGSQIIFKRHPQTRYDIGDSFTKEYIFQTQAAYWIIPEYYQVVREDIKREPAEFVIEELVKE